MDKINSIYRKRIEQIKIDGEEFADSAMKGVYLKQREALDELHNEIGKIYIRYAKDGFLNITSTQKAVITADITKKLKAMGKELGSDEVTTVTNILSEIFKTTYYKNAFVLDEGIKGNLKFNILKKEYINAAVNEKFKGELFSDRIWKNKADMIDKLQKSITDAMKGNTTIDKIGRDIKNTFNVKATDSQRLVRTETARIQTQASYEIAKSVGIAYVMWSSTLDNSTNEEDAELDGKIWGIDEYHPEPPLHPNCRCCLINVPSSDWKPTQRKDNESKELIDNVTYNKWKEDKGVN